MKIKKLAIVNRGEVAVRIIRACQELGVKSVLLHSSADIKTRAFRMADETYCIGPGPTSESYLNIDSVILGVKTSGAQAVHPGFGFLSENADFAERCKKENIIFVGPSADAIRNLGDKVNCKEIAKKLGIPLIPGYQGDNQNIDALVSEAEKIGYPVMVKAAAGGGGRGMKMIRSKSESKELLESAQREALSAFGSSKVFLEKCLDRAKHIEFQIFGMADGKVIHLYDRECSIQRRHQKIIEEANSVSISNEIRKKMGDVACSLGEFVKYQGAGTVEFLYQDEQFYLLEVNTRLQVEHPVTELVMGVDLVKAQILTASGEKAFGFAGTSAGSCTGTVPGASTTEKCTNAPLSPKGHAIECRIYAENPFLGGVPSTGEITFVHWPDGPGRRFDYGFEAGDVVTEFYDSMIAKVIVWDETRPRAIEKLKTVLMDSVIFGVRTNIPFLLAMISHPDYIDSSVTTRWVDAHFSNPLPEYKMTDEEKLIFEKAKTFVGSPIGNQVVKEMPSPFQSFWRNSI